MSVFRMPARDRQDWHTARNLYDSTAVPGAPRMVVDLTWYDLTRGGYVTVEKARIQLRRIARCITFVEKTPTNTGRQLGRKRDLLWRLRAIETELGEELGKVALAQEGEA